MTKQKAESEGDYHENPLCSTDSTGVNPDVYQELYLRYYPVAVQIALKFRCSAEDAEDLAQRAMHKGLVERKCRHFDNFPGWLSVTIKHDYLNLVRQRKRFASQSLDATYNDCESDSNATIAETERELSTEPYTALLNALALAEWYKRAELTEREVQLIEMRHTYDMPVRNIVEITGLTAKRVSKILDKAKAKLRQSGHP